MHVSITNTHRSFKTYIKSVNIYDIKRFEFRWSVRFYNMIWEFLVLNATYNCYLERPSKVCIPFTVSCTKSRHSHFWSHNPLLEIKYIFLSGENSSWKWNSVNALITFLTWIHSLPKTVWCDKCTRCSPSLHRSVSSLDLPAFTDERLAAQGVNIFFHDPLIKLQA